MKHISVYCISLIVSFIAFISSAAGADCTPVVYAFRHAEDTDRNLNPIGTQHAALYPGMIANFESSPKYNNDFCSVKFVYAVSTLKPGNIGGTFNPYETALPLAVSAMEAAPIQTIGGQVLDEFFSGGVSPEELRNTLLANVAIGSSVAVFWTSDGLHDLGEAIVAGAGIPVKVGKTGPPRNAAYVFVYNQNTNSFMPPTKPTQYVQCYNVTNQNTTPKAFAKIIEGGAQKPLKYYCGTENNGNLPLIDNAVLYLLRGKICDTSLVTKDSTLNPAEYFGYCTSN